MNGRELQATALFLGTGLIVAITVAGMRASGWSGGQLDNRIEPLFWAGAIFAAVAVALFGVAAIPRVRATGGLIGTGIVLFLLGPLLCVVAVFADYWI